MKSTDYVHDKRAVTDSLYLTPDNKLVTRTGCKIQLPSAYFERGLAKFSTPPQILGIHCIIINDKQYGVMTLPCYIKVTPSSVEKIVVDGDDYTVFIFEPGSVVYPDMQVVKSTVAISKIFSEMVSSARVPWYIDYETHPKILGNFSKWTGLGVGKDRRTNELVSSINARDPNDRTVYYRSTLTTEADKKRLKPEWVSLRSVEFSATNTMSKLGGSYFTIGITSALVNPSTRVEGIERHLRN
jgi:hypothetical protein